jgi:hypothetical protein
MQAADRQAITQAANQIDEELQTDPEDCGESRDLGRRVLIVPPLGILFRVDAHARIVYVLSVWRFRQH